MKAHCRFFPDFVSVFLFSALILCAVWIVPSFAGGHGPYVKDELLVRPALFAQPEEITAVIKSHGAIEADELPQLRVKRIKVPANAIEAVKNALAKNPRFEFVENNYIAEPALLPTDKYYSSQWHLPNISAPQGWDISTGSSNIIIAVADTGVDASHPDLIGKFVPGYNFYANNTDTSDVYDHGTPVAGTAAAVSNNGLGVTGVAWQNLIMPIVISDPQGFSNSYLEAQAVIFATDNGAKVVNISFGGVGYSQTLQDAINYAWDRGVVVVASAGNEGFDTPKYPAAYIHTLAVAALNLVDTRAYFSNYGSWIDLTAPGVEIFTTSRGGGYTTVAGTSFSSPITAGLIGLMFSVNPNLMPAQIEEILKANSDDIGDVGFDLEYGYGKINAQRALQATLDTLALAPDTTAPSVTFVTPINGDTLQGLVTVTANALDNIKINRVELYIDSAIYGAATAEPFSFQWNSATMPSGVHTLQLIAYDASGNTASTTISVMGNGDITPPTVVITRPLNGAKVWGSPIISADASDESGISKVEFSVDGVRIGTIGYPPYMLWSWDTRQYANGTVHTITASAYDNTGHTNSDNVTVTIDNDITPPTITISSPKDGARLTKMVSVKATASDDRAVILMEIYIDGILKKSQSDNSVTSIFYKLDPRTLSSGAHVITVKARDCWSHITSSSITVYK